MPRPDGARSRRWIQVAVAAWAVAAYTIYLWLNAEGVLTVLARVVASSPSVSP